MPAVAVLGVGAVELGVPPVAEVYHANAVPVAERGVAVEPRQRLWGEVTPGALGDAFTVMLLAAEVVDAF